MAFSVAGPSKGKPRPVPTINVTPLVDVILVVLIIFMLVTPMMMKTFWLNVPKAATDEQQQQQQDSAEVDEAKKPLVMTVDQKGAISINKHPIDAAELASKLPRLLAAKDNKVLYFDAHDEAPYGAAAKAMDLSRAAGAHSIAIMTQNVAR
jgi:biopolymer transport protein ExbD/biopolymer transport protein TolR